MLEEEAVDSELLEECGKNLEEKLGDKFGSFLKEGLKLC
jgi:hypothetical protein